MYNDFVVIGPRHDPAGIPEAGIAPRGGWYRELLFAGDPALFNQYGRLLISPERHPHLKHELAAQWHEWLLSEGGQAAIADFRHNGGQLFFPNAR
jgi:ABC-type tungstate transport system permease subunit